MSLMFIRLKNDQWVTVIDGVQFEFNDIIMNTMEWYWGDISKRTISKFYKIQLYMDSYYVKMDEESNGVVKLNQNVLFPLLKSIWNS